MAMPSNWTEWINTGLGMIAGAVASFLALRRKYSHDSAGIAHDEVNTNLLKTLLSERDMAMATAREAWSQRTEDAKRIATLEANLQQREVDLKILKDQVFAFRLELRRLNNRLKRLDPNYDPTMLLDPDPDLDDDEEEQAKLSGSGRVE